MVKLIDLVQSAMPSTGNPYPRKFIRKMANSTPTANHLIPEPIVFN